MFNLRLAFNSEPSSHGSTI